MKISRKLLCIVYVFTGLAALVGCWGNNILLFQNTGIIDANVRFWQSTLATPVSRSITVDILCLGLAAIIWMLLEARRLSMRGRWLWVVFGLFIAIGAAFPWFLVHREIVLAKRDGTTCAGTLSAPDILGIVLIAIPILAYTLFALRH